MKFPDLSIGTRVRKITGDYHLDGTVVMVGVTLAGKFRVVVDHAPVAPGLLHIYAPELTRARNLMEAVT